MFTQNSNVIFATRFELPSSTGVAIADLGKLRNLVKSEMETAYPMTPDHDDLPSKFQLVGDPMKAHVRDQMNRSPFLSVTPSDRPQQASPLVCLAFSHKMHPTT